MASVLDSPSPPEAEQPSFREFGDSIGTRRLLFDNVLNAAKGLEPVSNNRHTLALQDVQYVGPERYSKAEYKKALLTGGTLSRRLQGRWVLSDNVDGHELASRRTTLAHVPYMTDHGTLVQRGNEYTLASQMRLSPGAFARQKANGELETHVNVMPGNGRSFRLQLQPDSGVYKIQMGQSSMPLYPLLSAMGATPAQLREAWGDELYSVNQAKSDPRVIGKLYDRIVSARDPHADGPTKAAAIVEAFRAMKLDPTISARTLDRDYGNLELPTFLAITKKLLAMNRKEAEPDDRDHLAYQRLYGPEDLIAERIAKDRTTLRKLLWKASAGQNLDHVPVGAFNDAINAAIMGSGLGNALEENNPSEVLDHQSRVTRMGVGGIASVDAVPNESRSVQPSHLGYIDILRSPESERAGVDMRLARGTRKGVDGKLYSPVMNLRTGKREMRTPQDLADKTIAFPGELRNNRPVVRAMVGGKPGYARRNEVDYEVPSMEDTFSPLANLIPLKGTVKGQRAVMASRMLTQALPLVDPEAPLVQGAMSDNPDRSYEEEYSKYMGAARADKPGRVTGVSAGGIELTYNDGTKDTVELHDNLPFNRRTFWHQTPAVRMGDAVQAGQLLASSNFTTKDGVTALGKNLRTAYLPFRGLNFEDAVVISETAARRFTSEHMYQHSGEWEAGHKRGRNTYASIFPGSHNRKMLENFDDDGVVKKGTEVEFGQPLVLRVRERERTHAQVHRGRAPTFVDDSIIWNHHGKGTVTDVERTDKGVNVVVKSQHAAEVGDKLSGRVGDKGVISAIVPDDEMPTDKEGKPFELLLSPLGIHSRVNPEQIIEAALGKIAAKTGKPYKVQDWTGKDMREFAAAELRKHQMSDTEDVLDQETGRKIANVMTGNRFFLKLYHTSASKGQGRNIGGYTAEGQPAKGGEAGSKRVGMLELSALLSHGVPHVIRDAKLVRGQAHPEYWQQFMAGHTPPPPQVPHVYQKFINQLRASGINPVRQGTKTHIMAMRDADIDQLAGDRELENIETVDWRGALKEKKGGLFDPTLTGGHGGTRWSKITLHESVPNPIMEDPIRRVLGLTQNQLRDVISGKEQLNGITGPSAVQKALSSINLERELYQVRQDIQSGSKTSRDKAVRKLGYLKSAERLGIHPRDWMLSKVPVLPPFFRPVTTMGAKKLPLVADANYLYKELFEANQNLKGLSTQIDDVGDERLALYDSLKAVVGLGDPLQRKNVERNVRGILRQVFSSSPKMSVIQRKLLSTNTDLVGRAVITPNPDLDMDHVGLPENKAWEVYAPLLVRNLTRRGLPGHRAMELVNKRDPLAREALLKEIDSRPIIITRAPVLHRYGVMAAKPVLVKGHTLQLSPLTVGGFNADFDGDAMNYYVPSTDEAAEEALEKMLPSKNLLSAANFKPHYKLTQEYLGGVYAATAQIDKKRPARTFATEQDAIRAYQRGEISVDQRVEILDH